MLRTAPLVPASECHKVVSLKRHIEGQRMNEISTIGLISRRACFRFTVLTRAVPLSCGGNYAVSEILRRPSIVRRWDEACSSAHYWARQVDALGTRYAFYRRLM